MIRSPQNHLYLEGLRIVILLIFGISDNLHIKAQSTFIPLHSQHEQFLSRLEIMVQKSNDLNLFSPNSLTRHIAVHEAGLQDSSSGNPSVKLSKIDRYNLETLLSNNSEWITREDKKGIFKNPPNMIEVNNDKFFFLLNPVFEIQQSKEIKYNQSVFHYAFGASLRGMASRNFGFYAYFTKHFERPPLFVQNKIGYVGSMPGAGIFRRRDKNKYDYFDFRGGVTFRALKYFDIQMAYDRSFVGNGYRSLILSDYSGNSLFLKVNTKIWKLNYETLYVDLAPQVSEISKAKVFSLAEKILAFHSLSINATKWLNIGVFQAQIIHEKDQYLYLNPIIFASSSKIKTNKPSNGFVGVDFKANLAKRMQIYGQIMIDEVKWKELRRQNGWWGDRFGGQFGIKYINLLNIDNLDLQVEMNAIRPYTYSYNDTLGNYSHYNQPLAHPTGANFIEGIGIVRYQPFSKVTVMSRVIFWRQGIDTANQNFGSDILKKFDSRPNEYGFTIPTGVGATGLNAQLLLTYELKPNLFMDGSFLVRTWKVESNILPKKSLIMFSAGIRMNILKREYDY